MFLIAPQGVAAASRGWDQPAALSLETLGELGSIAAVRRRVRRGETLFRADDPFRALYEVRAGWFKCTLGDAGGREQVIGFAMAGELLGIEGFASGRYTERASALEDSEVRVLPHAVLEKLADSMPAVQRYLHAQLAREIVRSHSLMMVLASMSAEQRIASFLLGLSRRCAERGVPAGELALPMTREDLGSYLGLTLETVSRVLSRFGKAGLIELGGKRVRVGDRVALAAAAGVRA